MPEPKRAGKKAEGDSAAFSEEERAAMREHAREQKAAQAGANDEAAVLEKIGEMPEADRVIAERLHALVRATAPDLAPRTWYGMPAYAKGGKVLCFLQSAAKFKSRYATLGFSDQAKLDDGSMWPTSFALKEWTADVEAQIGALLKRAIG